MRKRLLSTMLFAWVPGCAATSTSITAYRDPEFSGRVYSDLLVVADRVSLPWRQAIEMSVVSRLREAGAAAREGTEVFKPTRKYTEDEIAAALREHGFDGMLWIELVGESVESVYVPPEAHAYYGIYSTDLYYYGGYYRSYPLLRFKTRLQDQATGENAWVASSITRGAGDADPVELAESLADALVEQLIEDGLLPAPAKD